ncbi:MAG: COX15/CtaA family protein [Rhodocyclaceae bacterium]|jgi:cytochrome c oxidase assembly protein subunit 15|nr:COX15/CtaA family protein [Rhodocyclaceae bacterium]
MERESVVGVIAVRDAARDRTQIAIWLLSCCALVLGIVIIGGLTRLTGSGLSMVEWKPIVGLLPPLDEAQWLATFELYRQSPEYRYVNIGMTVEGFKSIFWLEYIHRMIGRFIGIAFFVPFLYFWIRGKIEKGLLPKLVAMFVLGGMQGALGWYMVASGLAEDPHVSQYRLTAHLGLAIVIYVYMLWVALGLLWRSRSGDDTDGRPLLGWAVACTALAFCTVLSGGFVAGLKAGFAYNTFPLMGGQWIPDGIFALQPGWRNFFENFITAQFTHRILAISLLAGILALWRALGRRRLAPATRVATHAMLLLIVLQVALGISTLVLHVPLALASAHQAVAVLVLTSLVVVTHRLLHVQGRSLA